MSLGRAAMWIAAIGVLLGGGFALAEEPAPKADCNTLSACLSELGLDDPRVSIGRRARNKGLGDHERLTGNKLFPNDVSDNRDGNAGTGLALDGDLAVVSAPFLGSTLGRRFGVVFLFERNVGGAGNWGQLTTIRPFDDHPGRSRIRNQDNANAGLAVALDGTTIAISGAGVDMNDPIIADTLLRTDTGSVWVYSLIPDGDSACPTDSSFADESAYCAVEPNALLRTPDANNGTRFGDALALDGDTLAISASGLQVNINDGLVARFTFDADATDSIGSFSGTLTSGATITTDSRVGVGALDLRGVDGYVDLPSWPVGDQAGECTITFWASTESISADGFNAIVHSDDLGVGGVRVPISGSRNVGFNNSAFFGSPDVSAAIPTDNQWVHVAISFSRAENNSVIWVNGQETIRQDLPGGLLGLSEGYCGNSLPGSVGAWDSNPGGAGLTHFHDGRIDDLRFYDRRLNSHEVQGIIDSPETFIRQGAFAIHERSLGGSGAWGQRIRVVGVDIRELDLSGDRLLKLSEFGPQDVEVFERDQGGTNTWGSAASLALPPGGTSFSTSNIGQNIAISGDDIFVRGQDPSTTLWRYDASAGYAFQQTLNNCNGNFFMAADTDTLAVGDNEVCIYRRDQGGANSWGQVVQIPRPVGASGFSRVLSLSGDEILVGAPSADLPNSNSAAGRVFLYAANEGGTDNWGQVTILDRQDANVANRFGVSLAQDGNVLVVGANGDNNVVSQRGGAAYVFERSNPQSDWQFSAKLQPGNFGGDTYNLGGNFGFSVAVSGNTVLVTDLSHSPTGYVGVGIGFVYEKEFGTWNLKKILQPSPAVLALGTQETGNIGRFGFSSALKGDTIVIPMSFVQDFTSGDLGGRLFVFGRDEGGPDNWGLTADIPVPYNSGFEDFGRSVALSEDETLAIVGASLNDDGGDINTGAAYIFERDLGGSSAWGQRVRLLPVSLQSGDQFGRSVAIDSTRAVVMAPNSSAQAGQTETGKMFVFNRNSGGADAWGLEDISTPSVDLAFQNMGVSVSLAGEFIAAGAPSFGDAIFGEEGGAFLWAFDAGDAGDPWKEIAAIRASDGFVGNFFGRGIDFSDRTLTVGASTDGESALDAGAVYVLRLPDLTVNGIAGPVQADAGSTVSLTVTAANAGDGPAEGINLAVDLPSACASLSATSAAAGWAASNPAAGVLRVSRSIASLAAQANSPEPLSLDLSPTVPIPAACTPMSLEARVDNLGTSGTRDYFLTNDTATANLNVVEPINQPPVGSVPNQEFSGGVALSFNFNDFFTDPNGDAMTFAASGLPSSLTLNSTSGVVSGTTTANDFNNSPFSVTVTATDVPAGASSTPVNFSLTLTNEAPVELFPLSSYVTVVGEDLLIDITPHFADPDGQTLQYSLSGSPAYTINNFGQPGLIRGVATTTQLQQSPLTLNLTIFDGFGQQLVRQLTIQVEDQLAPQFAFERFFPALQQPWYFSDIRDVEAAPDGSIYLADAERGRVMRFSKDGLLITQWGQLGSDPGAFTFLSLKLAVGPDGLVYVISGSRLQTFGKNGEFLSEVDLVDDLIDVATDPNNQLYLLLSDGLSQRVEIRDAEQFGLIKETVPVARPPSAMTVTDAGRIYVAMRSSGSPVNNDQVVPYDPPTYAPGSPIATVDADNLSLDSSGILYAVGDADGTVRGYDAAGALQLNNDVSSVGGNVLKAIAFGQQDRSYISNGGSIFSVEANLAMRQFAWQSASSDVGRFRQPLDIGRDGSDTLYVVEASQNRVQRFSRDGDILAGWDLQQAVANPETARVYLHATTFSPTRVLISTGTALEYYDASGNMITPNPYDPGGLSQPGPIDETPTGNLVITDTGGAGTQVWVINSSGTVVQGPWTAANCNATGMTVGLNNLVYLLCEPGIAAREIQVFNQAGQAISTATINLPPGNPRGLASDDNGRLFLLNTENEIDLGFGISSSDSLVRVFRSDGVELGQLGASGYSAGRFDLGGEVAGVEISSSGDLLVAEPGNNRVQVFNPQIASRNAKAIVVAGGGDYPENFLWEATQINANNAYDKLIYQGFTEDRIQYLHPDPNLDLDGNPATVEVDGPPTLLELEQAITVWAADADNLVLYLADHGNKEVFRLNPQEIIDSGTLAAWIALLQDNVWPERAQPPVGNNGWINVVYEACESGTFQDNLAPINGVGTNKRVVITTSSSDENASFIAQGLLSFSYQFWINVFNGENARDAFELASATISDAYPQQSPLLSLVDGGNLVNDLDSYFNDGGANAAFAGRFIGNGTTNRFLGPEILSPSATLLSGSEGLLEVQNVMSDNDVSRVWAVIEPPGYRVRDSENPILELPTIDLEMDCGVSVDYCATFSGFTTVGDYRIQFLAQDIFGTVSRLAGAQVTLTVGNPLRNKAALFIAGGQDERGQARLTNGDFAYQALLRQDFVNDLDPDATGVGTAEDEVRYFTQGQFVGADIGVPGTPELDNLVTSGFADGNTQHLAIVIMADYDDSAGGLVFDGGDVITVADLQSFLATVEGEIQGRIAVILEGDGTGAVIPQLAENSARRLLLSSTSPNETAKLLGAGGVSFSKFFWNAIRDGFSLGTSFQLAASAIAQGVGVQTPMLDDNGNGISNDPNDQLVARNFFLGPGLARAGNGPLVGRLPPDVVISGENVTSASILAENVTSLSDAAISVMGSVSVPGTQLQVGEFMLTSVNGSQKGQQVINLGDFRGTFDGFVAAGDYDVAVFAVDDKGNPSTPQRTRVRKTAGGDIFEIDNTPGASTPLIRDAAPQRHTLHLVDDEDWLVFYLSDSAVRVLDLSFSELDPGLRLQLELYDDTRLTNDQATPILSQTIDPSIAGTDVSLADTLPSGRYFLRLSRQSFNPQPDSDPSPGYRIGLSSPFGALGGLLRGKVVDANTGAAIGLARVAAVTSDGAFCGAPSCEAGVVPSCDRASCGDPGGFVLFLNQGSYDVAVSVPGYEDAIVSALQVEPGGTTFVVPGPIALTPEATVAAPEVVLDSAVAPGEVSADLRGRVNANGSQTTGRFLVGLDAQSLTEINPGFLVVGSSEQQVGTAATGLTCSTTYLARLAAENAGGQSISATSTFTTATCGSTGLDQIFSNGFEQ